MFANPEAFGKYVLDFEYMLVDVKGYDDESLKKFSSKLLGVILMLEKTRNDVEFFNSIRDSLNEIEGFDNEEKRIFNLCVKIMDIAYGYNKSDEIKELLDENRIKEVDSMLCDIIENAKLEKEQLVAQGEFKKALEVAKKMLLENFPIDIIIRVTELPREQIEAIEF